MKTAQTKERLREKAKNYRAAATKDNIENTSQIRQNPAMTEEELIALFSEGTSGSEQNQNKQEDEKINKKKKNKKK
jgi:hypothetical protein